VRITNSVVFDGVALGAKSRLTECVVGEGSRLGRDVTIEPLAVVGEACDVGHGVQIGAHSRVGPATPVASGTLIEGVVEPRLQRLNGLQRIAISGPVMGKLLPDEREVYALLAEYGEMTARDIAETSTLPLLRVMTVLHSLEKQDLALSTQDHPRRYALTSEEQNLPRRILIVDDADELRDLMRLMFATQGHSLRTARDGIEAVEAVRDERFDAIIMDAEMPNLNGWDATRLIRGMPNGRTVPVVIYTGYTGQDAQGRAQEVGASGLLNKSVLPEQMLPQVLQMISK
jgi:CheY-like chemotaxis protein/carbonic anhydrase/acetyltransferase-like protein (isoleucine patch superfamily)